MSEMRPEIQKLMWKYGVSEQSAIARRNSVSIPILAVTGSMGKTTAKEMVWSVLSQRWNTHKSAGNQNGEAGVPITVSGLLPEHEAAVVEIGVSQFGEMRRSASIVRPTMALFTGIGRSHLEFLQDLDGVFAAKTEILEYMEADAPLFLNGDDVYLRPLKHRKNAVTFGLAGQNDVHAENIYTRPDGSLGCTVLFRDNAVDVSVPAYGQHMIYAVLAAAAVGFTMGLDCEEIRKGIEAYRPVGRRGILTDTGYYTVVDDSYNANPDSMMLAVNSLLFLSGRHVCIVADMLELGSRSEQYHREVGRYMRAKGVDCVLGYGIQCRAICEEFGECGHWFPDISALMASMEDYLQKGDRILVKASHSMRMDIIADRIKNLGLWYKVNSQGNG